MNVSRNLCRSVPIKASRTLSRLSIQTNRSKLYAIQLHQESGLAPDPDLGLLTSITIRLFIKTRLDLDLDLDLDLEIRLDSRSYNLDSRS